MTLENIKRTINKLLNKVEDQALDEGIDITSDRFQEIMELAKAKLLKVNGLTFEQFNAIGKDNKEEEIKQEREDHSKEIEELQQTNQEIKEKVLIQTEKIKGLEALSTQQKDNFKIKLSLLKDELENTKELSLERKVLIQEDLINITDKLKEISINGTKDIQEIKDISKEQVEKQEQFNKKITLKNKEHEEDIDLLADTANKLWTAK
jgi:hypothetical protein